MGGGNVQDPHRAVHRLRHQLPPHRAVRSRQVCKRTGGRLERTFLGKLIAALRLATSLLAVHCRATRIKGLCEWRWPWLTVAVLLVHILCGWPCSDTDAMGLRC